jgi:hypothetical protein
VSGFQKSSIKGLGSRGEVLQAPGDRSAKASACGAGRAACARPRPDAFLQELSGDLRVVHGGSKCPLQSGPRHDFGGSEMGKVVTGNNSGFVSDGEGERSAEMGRS